MAGVDQEVEQDLLELHRVPVDLDARLDLHAKATQDVSVTTRLAMYKTFGAQDERVGAVPVPQGWQCPR